MYFGCVLRAQKEILWVMMTTVLEGYFPRTVLFPC